jgi:hypothetical protein
MMQVYLKDSVQFVLEMEQVGRFSLKFLNGWKSRDVMELYMNYELIRVLNSIF